jgi:hypothetical protein
VKARTVSKVKVKGEGWWKVDGLVVRVGAQRVVSAFFVKVKKTSNAVRMKN